MTFMLTTFKTFITFYILDIKHKKSQIQKKIDAELSY